jgi:thioredoxin 1
MSVTDVNSSNFESEVLESDIPVVVDVWAEWCGPCRIFSPVVDEVSQAYEGKVKFVKLNADDNEDIAAKYNIMSRPTALLIENGKVKAQSVGAIPAESLRSWIDSNI